MFREDLSIYYWNDGERLVELPQVRCVGWISPDVVFKKGDVDKLQFTKLQDVVLLDYKNGAEISDRGFATTSLRLEREPIYPCALCPQAGHQFLDPNNPIPRLRCMLGIYTLLLPGSSREFFAFPDLMVHYIGHHSYCPPKIFLNALMKFDLGSSFNAVIAAGSLLKRRRAKR